MHGGSRLIWLDRPRPAIGIGVFMRTRAGDARVTFAVFSWIPVPACQPLCDERPDPAPQAHMPPTSIRSIHRGGNYVAVDGARPVGLGACVRGLGCNARESGVWGTSV